VPAVLPAHHGFITISSQRAVSTIKQNIKTAKTAITEVYRTAWFGINAE